MKSNNLRNKLILTTSMVAASLFGGAYGSRQADAACVLIGGTYGCEGASGGININAANAQVATLPVPPFTPFVINEAAGDGLVIRGDGALSFTDNYASSITASEDALEVRAYAAQPGGITVIADTTLNGGDDGFFAYNYGDGDNTVTLTGNVTGAGGFGITVRNTDAAGGNVSLTTGAGTVYGYSHGIQVGNPGTGSTSVTTGAGSVTGANSYGIGAYNSTNATGALTVTTGTGAVTGATDGIYARNYGTAGISITVNGDVTGNGNHGINAYNSANDTTASMVITQAAGTTTYGLVNGINANNFGGSLTINANGTSIGGTGDGIYANNNVGTTFLNITANNATGFDDGIDANNYGTGGLTVTANGTVTGNNDDGIEATNSANGTSLLVTTNYGSAVTGGNDGIEAFNSGTGSSYVRAYGNVTGNGNRGIALTNTAAGGYAAVRTGYGTTVAGNYVGIGVYNNGVSGAYAFTGGNSNVTSANSTGLFLTNSANGTRVRAYTGAGSNVTGSGFIGIDARNYGNADVIVSTGALSTVTGGVSDGILAINSAAGTYLTVTTGAGSTVTGADDGIDARNFGTAGLTITVNGDVTGTGNHGINAYNSANDVAASMVITQAYGTTTTGLVNGINANNFGGSLRIYADGTSIGLTGDGIYADNNAGTTFTYIRANNATGYDDGIDANHYGTGALTIVTNAFGAITGNYGNGIEAYNSIFGTNLTVNTGYASNVTGYIDGINAFNFGTGALSVTTGNYSTTTGIFNNGITAYNSIFGTNLTVNTGQGSNVTGYFDGINAFNNGAGALSVTTGAYSTTTGVLGNGITAYNSIFGTNLTVNTGQGSNVTGYIDGINANNVGTGALSVTTGAFSTTTGVLGNGITAYNSIFGTNLTVNTGQGSNVTGYFDGIYADNNGTGALTVTANGNVTGTNGRGIYADNSIYGTNLTVNTGAFTNVQGYSRGIRAANYGSGAVSITTGYYSTVNATSAGAGATGIRTYNSAAGTSLSVTTGQGSLVSAAGYGIRAANLGTGPTNVTTGFNSTVQATAPGVGIGIRTFSTNGDQTVATGAYSAVTGGYRGIQARNEGDALTVTTGYGSTVTGTVNDGINARNNPGTTSTSLTVTTGVFSTVTGGRHAINAINYGSGANTVTVNGLASGQIFGVRATNYVSATPLTVNVGTFGLVEGGNAGIYGFNAADGIAINNSGTVRNLSAVDSDLAITTTNGGATTVTNNASGTILGRLNLSAFSDTVNNVGLWITEAVSNFGGGNDTVNNSGTTVTGDEAGLREVTNLNNLENFNNTGLLDMSDETAGNGNGFGDNTNDQTNMPTANFFGGAGSTMAIDAFLGAPGSQSDELAVNTTSGLTGLNVVDTNAGPGGFNPTGILVVDANASSAADFAVNNFTSVNGVQAIVNGKVVLDKGLFFYDLVYDAPNADHLFVGVPDREAFEPSRVVSAIQTIGHETTGVWLDRQADLRDVVAGRRGMVTATADLPEPIQGYAGGTNGGMWVRALGSWTDRDSDESFTLFNTTYNFDLGYDQTLYGVMGGADFGTQVGDSGTLLFGVLGGYLNSDVDFKVGPTNANIKGGTVGGYITYLNSGFFIDALVKADLLNMDYNAPSIPAAFGNSASTDVTNINVVGDLGYRFGTQAFFIEPVATLSYVSTHVDNFTLGGATVSAGTNDSLRGGIGARLGAQLGQGLEISATGRVWNEFEGNNQVNILSAGLPLVTNDDLDGTFGEVNGILNWVMSSQTSMFVKGGVKFDDDFTTSTVTGGVRYEF